MTKPLFSSTLLDASPTQYTLTAGDAERIATVIDAKLAPSTRQVYASVWRLWEQWRRGSGIIALPVISAVDCERDRSP